MLANKKLDPLRIGILSLLLKYDNVIMSPFLFNMPNGGTISAKSIVIHEDGSVVFGRTSCQWWNTLCKENKRYGFGELVIAIKNAINKYQSKDTDFNKSMDKILVDNYLNEKEGKSYNSIVDGLFMAAISGTTGGMMCSEYIAEIKEIAKTQLEKVERDNQQRNINVVDAMLGGFVTFGDASFPVIGKFTPNKK